MRENPQDPTHPPEPASKRRGLNKAPQALAREARLKAALKANMAKRKAQGKARSAGMDGSDGNKKE